ncbi:MAG: HAMP domain-containing protein [Muribaculaceae bacterium]|nr:HAMP domain-containing protein [Muribaculaceae bacterium]
MNLKLLFYISVALQLSTWGFMLTLDFRVRNTAFFILEGLTILNIVYLIYFYRKVNRPIQSLSEGLDLLKGQDWNSRLTPVGQPEVDNIAETFNRMITMLKEHRLRLEEQSHFLNLIIARAPIGMLLLNFDDKVYLANPAAERIFGISGEKLTEMSLAALPGSLGDCLASMKANDTRIIRTEHNATYKCTCLSLVDKGVVHRFILIEDVGDAMADAERQAYEKIIRIIAHEVNNTVAPTASALGVVSDILPASNPAVPLLQSCSERVLGMSAFVSRLAEVVKIPEAVLKPCNINDLISGNRPFLESLCMPAGCNISFELCADNAVCMADVPLLEQCLVNIVKNAVESISETKHAGNVSIATSRAQNGAVVLTVTDNGAGISPEKNLKIFTPFYTDKPTGQGVGLTFVREVLRRHNCGYSLQTGADGLTRFTIEFPVKH